MQPRSIRSWSALLVSAAARQKMRPRVHGPNSIQERRCQACQPARPGSNRHVSGREPMATNRFPVTLELVSAGGFMLSLAVFAAASEEQSPRLDRTRWCCLALTGSLLWIGLVGHPAAWVTVVSCLGFLVSLVAVALAAYAEREAIEEEPAWWPDFERDFRAYARQALRTNGTE
jgi:hypothetical protein